MSKKIITSIFLVIFVLAQSLVPVKTANALTTQTLAFDTKVTGYITETNYKNMYKIQLPKAGKLNLNMISELGLVSVYLTDSTSKEIFNETIHNGSQQTPSTWATSIDLEAGTYYFTVARWDTPYTGKYTISAKFAAANTSDKEPNNGTTKAQDLTLNAKPLSGYISWNDDQDTYKVSLPKAGKLDLNMISQLGLVSVYFKNSAGKEIFNETIHNGSQQTPSTWATSIDLEAGTYYFTVARWDTPYTGKYTLSAKFAAANTCDKEPNNGTTNAQDLTLNAKPLSGYISWNDAQDTYKVYLPKAGKIDLNMISQLGLVSVYFKDSAGKEIFNETIHNGSQQTPSTWSTSVNLSAGTYFFTVARWDTPYTGKYSLSASAPWLITKVNKVTLDKSSLSMNLGDSPAKLNAVINPTNATNKNVTWKSDNPKIATVDKNGFVNAIGIGKTKITVTTADGNKTAVCVINVAPKKPTSVPVNNLTLSIALKINSSINFGVLVNPTNATDKTVIWSSSNSSIVSVTKNGTIKALKSGTAVITVMTKDGKNKTSILITVTK